MRIPKAEYLEDIRSLLSEIETTIKKQMSFFDDGTSHISELFIEELLNIVYQPKGYSFKNLNYKKKNHPALDLGDEENKIAWQVTATHADSLNKKIKSTLESLILYNCDKTYNQIYIFSLAGKPKTIKQ